MPDINNPVGNGTVVWRGNRDPTISDDGTQYRATACRTTSNSCLGLFTAPTTTVDLPASLDYSEIQEMFINVEGGEADLEFPNDYTSLIGPPNPDRINFQCHLYSREERHAQWLIFG